MVLFLRENPVAGSWPRAIAHVPQRARVPFVEEPEHCHSIREEITPGRKDIP